MEQVYGHRLLTSSYLKYLIVSCRFFNLFESYVNDRQHNFYSDLLNNQEYIKFVTLDHRKRHEVQIKS